MHKIPLSSQQLLPIKAEIDRRADSADREEAKEVDLLLLSCQEPSVFFRRYIKLNDSGQIVQNITKIDIYFTQLLFVFTPHFFVQKSFKRGRNTCIFRMSCKWFQKCGSQASLSCKCVYIVRCKPRKSKWHVSDYFGHNLADISLYLYGMYWEIKIKCYSIFPFEAIITIYMMLRMLDGQQ